MRLIDADALIDRMYYDAFENDKSYNEENPMAKWDSGLWIRFKLFENVMNDLPNIKCKTIHYFDEDEHIWKSGNVIINEQ